MLAAARILALSLSVLVGGCLGPRLIAEAEMEPIADPASTSGGDSEPPGSDGRVTTTTTTGVPEPADGSSGGSGNDDSRTFLQQPDLDPVPSCDVWNDDCPRGMKCTFWGPDGGSWSGTRCVPLADEPAGVDEPCEMLGDLTSGLDDCQAGSMCWSVDAKTGHGHCVAFCIGSADNPNCEEPCKVCTVTGGPLALCPTQCDPLLQACPAGEACYPTHGTFVCAADVSDGGGQAGTACEFINICEKGTVCLDPDSWPDGTCDTTAAGCCIPTCDVQAADPCPNTPAGVACVPWYDEERTPIGCGEWGSIGVCIVPPA